MQRQFTATVYVMESDRVLLIYHKKLKKWLPPGGHVDPGETPAEAAIREVKEETGLSVRLIRDENIWIEESNARSFERPYLCLLEEIPAYGNEPAHQHMDMVYLGTPLGGTLKANEQEIHDCRWFDWDEILQLEVENDIFKETRDTLETLLGAPACP